MRASPHGPRRYEYENTNWQKPQRRTSIARPARVVVGSRLLSALNAPMEGSSESDHSVDPSLKTGHATCRVLTDEGLWSPSGGNGDVHWGAGLDRDAMKETQVFT